MFLKGSKHLSWVQVPLYHPHLAISPPYNHNLGEVDVLRGQGNQAHPAGHLWQFPLQNSNTVDIRWVYCCCSLWDTKNNNERWKHNLICIPGMTYEVLSTTVDYFSYINSIVTVILNFPCDQTSIYFTNSFYVLHLCYYSIAQSAFATLI